MAGDKVNDVKGNRDKKGVGMSNQELRREKRRQHALERLGTNTPRCAECGIAARDFDDGATVILCRNCHRKLSDHQKDHPEPTSSPPNLFTGHFLLGLYDLFISLAEKCLEYGLALIEYAKTFAEQSQVRP